MAQTAAERRTAQRRLARQRHSPEGYKPSATGKQARQQANLSRFWSNPEKYANHDVLRSLPRDLKVTPDRRNKLETLYVQNFNRQLGDKNKRLGGYNEFFVQEMASLATVEQLIAGIGATDDEIEDWARPQRQSDAKIGPFAGYAGHDRKSGRSKIYLVNTFWYHGDYHSAGE